MFDICESCNGMKPPEFLEWWVGVLGRLHEEGGVWIEDFSGIVIDGLEGPLLDIWNSVLRELIDVLPGLEIQDEPEGFEDERRDLCALICGLPEGGGTWPADVDFISVLIRIKEIIEGWLNLNPAEHAHIIELCRALKQLLCILRCLSIQPRPVS